MHQIIDRTACVRKQWIQQRIPTLDSWINHWKYSYTRIRYKHAFPRYLLCKFWLKHRLHLVFNRSLVHRLTDRGQVKFVLCFSLHGFKVFYKFQIHGHWYSPRFLHKIRSQNCNRGGWLGDVSGFHVYIGRPRRRRGDLTLSVVYIRANKCLLFGGYFSFLSTGFCESTHSI